MHYACTNQGTVITRQVALLGLAYSAVTVHRFATLTMGIATKYPSTASFPSQLFWMYQ